MFNEIEMCVLGSFKGIEHLSGVIEGVVSLKQVDFLWDQMGDLSINLNGSS